MQTVPTELLASGSVRLKAPGHFGGYLIWVESLPEKSNIYTLMGVPVDSFNEVKGAVPEKVDLLADYAFDVASRIHGYGGRAWWPGEDYLFFASKFDGAVYAFDLVNPPYPVTAGEVGTNWADGCSDRAGGFVAVRESNGASDEGTVSQIVHKSVEGAETVIAEGADFYSDPRVSPDGASLCWVEWDLPNMPWDVTSIKTCALTVTDSGASVAKVSTVTSGSSSALNPAWIDDKALGYVDDESGFWDLYVYNLESQQSSNLTSEVSVGDGRGEINRVAWFMGDSRWQPLADGKVVVAWTAQAVDSLIVLQTADLSCKQVSADLIEYFELASIGDSIMAIGSAERSGTEIRVFESESETVLRPPVVTAEQFHFSAPENISFDSEGISIQAFYYAPVDESRVINGLAPLIVMCHGGPTGYTTSAMNLKIQYWASRGFGVIDVNYRGSTGFGREFRHSLNGQWGVYDVADLIAAAKHMVAKGNTDPDRIAIRGGSSGGLTVMLALANSDLFCGGVSLYGVSDMHTIANASHKFESGYLDTLIGPLPEFIADYDARSPINFPEKIKSPVLMVHGTDDPIVPIGQSRKMYDVISNSGGQSDLVELFGEGHGFRAPDNIIKAFESELAFYNQVMI